MTARSQSASSEEPDIRQPAYFGLVREQAAKEGISEAEFLARDRAHAKNPDYPTEQCLVPDEALQLLAFFVAQYDPEKRLYSLIPQSEGNISEEVAGYREHVEACPFCGVMVASMQPSTDKREEFLEAVRDLTGSVSPTLHSVPVHVQSHYLRRQSQLGIAILCVVAALALPYLLSVAFSRTFTVALGEVSRHFFLIAALFVATTLLMVPKLFKRLGRILLGSFARTGRAIVSYRWLEAGAFACVCVSLFYGVQALNLRKEVLASRAQFRPLAASYLEHRYLSTALAPIAQSGSGFQLVDEVIVGDSTVYVAKRPDIPGNFITRIEGDAADVSWTIGEKTVPQFKLQVGQLKSLGGNELGFALATGDLLHVSGNLSTHALTEGGLAVAQIVRAGDENRALILKAVDTKSSTSPKKNK